jgi:capsid protein
MRDLADYEYNELQAAAMSACVVLGYRRSSGQTQFGLDADSDWSLTDTNGNPITNIAPGMFLDLGKTGELQSFNPQRPNASLPEFSQHLVREIAGSSPGIKPTSLTGDYRNSSFSSERSSENDTWPELEGLQDWMAWSFCQPIYEEVITAAVAEGYFDGVEGFTPEDFNERRAEYLLTDWQGPVGRSINPKDDAEAGIRRMKSLTSSPQREIAMLGGTIDDVLEEWEDLMEQMSARNLPAEQVLMTLLGVQPEQEAESQGGDDGDEREEAGSQAAS